MLSLESPVAGFEVVAIDDDEMMLELLRITLERQGLKVKGIGDPCEAHELVRSSSPDLVILDWMMPGTSGEEVLGLLRSDPETRDLPILFLSSRSGVDERVSIIRQGADDFLAKPFEPTELVARVERLLARSAAVRSSLQGSLETHSLPEVLQMLSSDRKGGVVVVETSAGRGSIWIEKGEIVASRSGQLEGEDALLQLVTASTGRFRFEEDAPRPRAATSEEDLPRLPALLMEAAWIEDELSQRAELIPQGEFEVRRAAAELPGLPEAFEGFPFEKLWAELSAARPWSEIVPLLQVAPLRAQLTLGLLLECGAVFAGPAGSTDVEVQVASSAAGASLESSIDHWIEVLQGEGWGNRGLHLLLAAEPAFFARVEQLIESLGTDQAEESNLSFGRRLEVSTEAGTVIVHSQLLTPEASSEIDAMAVVATAAVFWVEGRMSREMKQIAEKMARRAGPSRRGYLIPAHADAEIAAQTFLEAQTQWRALEESPAGLAELFREMSYRG